MKQLSPDELARMTPPERLALITQLWDSLEHDEIPLTTAPQAGLIAVWIPEITTGETP